MPMVITSSTWGRMVGLHLRTMASKAWRLSSNCSTATSSSCSASSVASRMHCSRAGRRSSTCAFIRSPSCRTSEPAMCRWVVFPCGPPCDCGRCRCKPSTVSRHVLRWVSSSMCGERAAMACMARFRTVERRSIRQFRNPGSHWFMASLHAVPQCTEATWITSSTSTSTSVSHRSRSKACCNHGAAACTAACARDPHSTCVSTFFAPTAACCPASCPFRSRAFPFRSVQVRATSACTSLASASSCTRATSGTKHCCAMLLTSPMGSSTPRTTLVQIVRSHSTSKHTVGSSTTCARSAHAMYR
mmetsp:Transcript_6307/g.39288  ORF Transcript_6307/g.39288 Transcript_6307/m.39288 type:complete len:302 (-) Transcript_6307:247-1152(-)